MKALKPLTPRPPMKPLTLDGEEFRIFNAIREARFNPKTATQDERDRSRNLLEFAPPRLLDYLAELMTPGEAPHLRFASWKEAGKGIELDGRGVVGGPTTLPPPGSEGEG
jgi:hypothetical protein